MSEFNMDTLKELDKRIKDTGPMLHSVTCRPDYHAELFGLAKEYTEGRPFFGVEVYLVPEQKEPVKVFYNKKDVRVYLKKYERQEKTK